MLYVVNRKLCAPEWCGGSVELKMFHLANGHLDLIALDVMFSPVKLRLTILQTIHTIFPTFPPLTFPATVVQITGGAAIRFRLMKVQ